MTCLYMNRTQKTAVATFLYEYYRVDIGKLFPKKINLEYYIKYTNIYSKAQLRFEKSHAGQKPKRELKLTRGSSAEPAAAWCKGMSVGL